MTPLAMTEYIQLVVASIGLGVAHWNLWVAVQDAIAIAIAGGSTNTAKITATRSISREIMLLMANGTLALAGIIAVLLDDQCPDMKQHILQNLLLIALTVLLAFDALLERHARATFDAVLDRRAAPTVWDVLSFFRRKP